MPTTTRVQDFVQLLESGQTLEALREFYTKDARQWENQQEERAGLEHLLAHEKHMLRMVSDLRLRVVSRLIEGDQVVLNYRIDGSTPGGGFHLDELVLQHWQGDKIKSEHFYYDPAQRTPRRNK